MSGFKVLVELTCKTCGMKFPSEIPDEFNIQPERPGVRPVTITIEELRGDVTKDITDISGRVVGRLDLKDFEFDITHPKCNNTNKYSVNDCTFLPS